MRACTKKSGKKGKCCYFPSQQGTRRSDIVSYVHTYLAHSVPQVHERGSTIHHVVRLGFSRNWRGGGYCNAAPTKIVTMLFPRVLLNCSDRSDGRTRRTMNISKRKHKQTAGWSRSRCQASAEFGGIHLTRATIEAAVLGF